MKIKKKKTQIKNVIYKGNIKKTAYEFYKRKYLKLKDHCLYWNKN